MFSSRFVKYSLYLLLSSNNVSDLILKNRTGFCSLCSSSLKQSLNFLHLHIEVGCEVEGENLLFCGPEVNSNARRLCKYPPLKFYGLLELLYTEKKSLGCI